MNPVLVLDLGVNLLLLVVDATVIALVWRWRKQALGLCAIAAGLTSIFALIGGLWFGGEPFAGIRALAWVLFLHGPIDLVVAGILARTAAKVDAGLLVVSGVACLAVGVDGFFVEPYALDVETFEVEARGLEEPIRIAILADVQDDHLGDREREVFERTMEEEPDLILFAGDYLHLVLEPESVYEEEAEKWKELLEILDAPLGIYAVRGNAEMRGTWSPDLFGGTGVTTFRRTASVDLGPIVLTGLSFEDGFNPAFSVDGTEKFHVAFAHGPDFSLSEKARADLLIAGHTHGGQVVVPFFGPPVTYSAVPRHHAAGGLHELSGGRRLVVSRGVGMERVFAPRLRVNCRPELVFVDLVPPTSTAP